MIDDEENFFRVLFGGGGSVGDEVFDDLEVQISVPEVVHVFPAADGIELDNYIVFDMEAAARLGVEIVARALCGVSPAELSNLLYRVAHTTPDDNDHALLNDLSRSIELLLLENKDE